MFSAQEMFRLDDPDVRETGFTPNEVQELLSLFQSPTNSGSEGSNRTVHSVDERKQRRMLSNRESARRSRLRKKRHLENLTQKSNQLKLENQELKNRLGSSLHHCHVLWLENARLRSESVILRAILSDLCQALVTVAMQKSC